ncbi:hypothetical protein [Haliangium ochraceum]|uniref:Uncharacterized protein n=1 Tax=Haliangium ochraceum (strain DSM 14365 / JCM 11303 / SMP-2) TaxID=502025 RepID=D0LQS4_HALO1|nr:hypothetical protein [Haliangium ochraceum]ACY13634.1 protein of unknown function DUF450 [Haliangium ochraceum DSM 14365]
MHEIDQGHEALNGITRTWGQLSLAQANEAETRLKVIDEVLFNVLGWSKDDVSVEERVSEDGETTFADYIIRTATVQVLVEAKKVGVAFELPTTRKALRLGGVLSEGEVGDAIRQARDYCRKKSIPFAAVTNGNTWVIFPAVRTDGIEFEKSDAHTFSSLAIVSERFVQFWELLSRQRVLEGSLTSELLGSEDQNRLRRCVRELHREPGFRLGRNALHSYLEPAIHQALTDEAILRDRDALEACYVKTSNRVKYDTRLRVFFGHGRAPLGHAPTRLGNKGRGKFTTAVTKTVTDTPPRFVVLLGKVGAGKTTFLHYTRLVSAVDAIEGKVLWLYIDFKAATKADRPRDFIYRMLLELIESDEQFELGDWEHSVRPAYRDEIEKLKRGPLNPLFRQKPDEFELKIAEQITRERDEGKPYVDRVLRNAASRLPGFLILDNLDQIEDDDFQGQVFLEAQALARIVGFNVIVSMRESTYLRHKESPAFDAFQFDSFYLDAPSILPVLSHRLAYAKRLLSGPAKIQTEKGMTVSVDDLGVFFEIVSSSLLSDESGQLLESLAGGNVRRGLELVRDFLASGHTNADRALMAYVKRGGYVFPTHEVLRGCILGPQKYFDERYSNVPNIYDAKTGNRASQMLRLRIVQLLVEHASLPGFEGVATTEIENAASQLGVAHQLVRNCLCWLVEKGVIQTSDGLSPSDQNSLLPTRFGAFLLRVLCKQFAYTEFCTFDSIIYDDDAWQDLKDLTSEIENEGDIVARVELRAERADRFLEYCERTEELLTVEARRRALPEDYAQQLVPDLRKKVGDDAVKALSSARRRYGSLDNDAVGSRARPIASACNTGKIANSWLDRDYVFITDESGRDWFSHRSDFLSQDEWNKRQTGKPCEFLAGEWRGKPRATQVKVF